MLKQSRAAGNDVAIVLITAQNLLENAVESMKAGALDYLVKPFALAAVKALSEKALATRALKDEVRSLRRAVGRAISPGGDRLVGSSTALLEIFKTVGKVAPRNVPVLIQGETGTGKELVARAIHSGGPRRHGPFVPVNCGALPAELIDERALRPRARRLHRGGQPPAGPVRPRRTAARSSSTRSASSPVRLQCKLLRLLQEGEVQRVGGRPPVAVDVRVVAATNRDLASWSTRGVSAPIATTG